MRTRIAWFSPLNTNPARPTNSVSAYVSDELLDYLSSSFDIDLFHDSFEKYKNYSTHHYLTAYRRHRTNPYDIFFYQVEDHPASDFTRFHVGLAPGITWFHDTFFLRDLPTPLHNSPWRQIIEKFNNSSLNWPERDSHYPRSLPFAIRECCQSFVNIFSSERYLDTYRIERGNTLKDVPHALAYYLPIPVDGSSLYSTRRPQYFMTKIAYCGLPNLEHRAHKLLSALSQLDNPCQLVWLLEESELSQARDLLKEFEISDVTFKTPRTPAHWKEIVETAEIAIHTLFSVYGHTEPYLSISLMAGVPSIVTNFANNELLPSGVVQKIYAGYGEAEEIANAIRKILDEPEKFRAVAKNYAREKSSSYCIAGELNDIFESTLFHIRKQRQRWTEFEHRAGESLIQECRSNYQHLLDACRTFANYSSPDWQLDCQSGYSDLGWT